MLTRPSQVLDEKRCQGHFAMRIHLLPVPQASVIAREDQLGILEGEFGVRPNGEVTYQHPSDTRVWYAGTSVSQFTAAAEAWNRYAESVVSVREPEQAQVVAQLR